MRRHDVAVAVMILSVMVAYGVRVYAVNASAERIPHEAYYAGEWLEPRDGYLIDNVVEDLDGFSLRLDGAKVMTANEYLKAYGSTGEVASVRDGNAPSVLAVTMTIKNSHNEKGGI